MVIKNRFLVAVDGSEQSAAALDYLTGFIPAEKTAVVLFHVFSQVPETFWDLDQDPSYRAHLIRAEVWKTQQKALMTDFMEKSRRKLRAAGFSDQDVELRIQERVQGVARDIIAEAAKGYEVIVVGRVGASSLQNLLLGSVATKILNKLADLSMCVIAGQPRPGKILVALDGSEGSRRAVEFVPNIVRDPEQEICLFHALRRLNLPSISQASPLEVENATKDLQDQTRGAIELFFDEAQAGLVKAGFNSRKITRRIISGVTSRAGTIIEEARKNDYSTIVVGRRGISRAQEFLMGRVSNKVIQLARDMAVWIIT